MKFWKKSGYTTLSPHKTAADCKWLTFIKGASAALEREKRSLFSPD